MNKTSLGSCLSLLFLLCMSLIARGQTIIINGPDKICVNSSSSYSVASPSSTLVYQWSLITGGTIIGSSFGNTVNIGWGASAGSVILSVSATPVGGGAPVGSGSKTISIVTKPQPDIVTTYRVACQSLAFDSAGNGTGRNTTDPPTPPTTDPDTLMDDDQDPPCAKVCENAFVTYSASISAGNSVSWSVTGGTIISGQNTGTLVVQWGPVGPGSVTLYESNGDCIGEKTICVDIIEKPYAAFAILPNTNPPDPVNDTAIVCLRSSVSFQNLTGINPSSPIVSWYWNYGDGTISSQKVAPSHTYNKAGKYVAYLVATNACGCRDTFRANIKVLTNPGPVIRCPSVVCENTEVDYTTGASCGAYNWSVVGGNITANTGNSIKVRWDHVDPDGFGYVTLAGVSCGALCEEPTTIKVPVVQEHPVVTGPLTICTNQQYQYSIPLWPGTQYNWGVINNPSAIYGTRYDNKVVLKFSNPGTYTVHLTYQNRIALCGGDIKFDVVVVPQDSIVGDMDACKGGASHLYTLFNGNSANWTLQSPLGSVYSGSGTSFSATFNEVGVWKLTADGTVCPTTVGINVTELQLGVDSIAGKRMVCMNTPTPYTAYNSLPNMLFSWDITPGSGTLSATSGDNVSVTWTSLPAQLIVHRQSTVYPYCTGPDSVITIIADSLNPHITGPDTLCANSYKNYSANYASEGATFKWEVLPQTAGSVTAGNYESNITFLADHFTVVTPAQLVVTVQQCNTTITDTQDIVIVPAKTPQIFSPDTVCSGDTVAFMGTVGGDSYTWLFGDGSILVPEVNTTTHVYNNGSGSGKLIRVDLNIAGWDDTTECPPAGNTTKLIYVKSGPQISMAVLDTTLYPCDSPIHTRFKVSVTGTHGALTYQWYCKPLTGINNTFLIGGATANTYTATFTGFFFCVVTDTKTGCKTATQMVDVRAQACPTAQCQGTLTFDFDIESCGYVKTKNGTPVSSTYFHPSYDIYPNAGNKLSFDEFQFFNAGKNTVIYSMDVKQSNGDTCRVEYSKVIDVPLVAHYKRNVACGTGSYIITLENTSSFMDPYQGNSQTISASWFVEKAGVGPVPGGSGTGNTFTLPSGLAGGQYVVTETVTLSPSNIQCTFVDSVLFIPYWPTVNIDYDPTSICEGVPVNFAPVITPTAAIPFIARYMWDFGDVAFSALDTTHRVYTYPGGLPPQPFGPFLTATDYEGCVHTSPTGTVNIWPNDLSGTVVGATEVCNGPVTLTYNSLAGSPTDYMWSNESVFGINTSINVTTSGSYFVTVEDVHKCRFVAQPADVTIHNLQATGISGEQDICEGDIIILSAFAGNDVVYQWKRNGVNVPASDGGNGPRILQYNVPAGSYSYEVELVLNTGTVSCTTTTAPYNVTVHTPPAAPAISGPSVIDCNTYELQLTGSPSGNLKWSNGAFGTTNTIFAGGAYRLWYTDAFGCTSHSDKYVPPSPESNFGWFPTGCYEICNQQFPFNLYGPPGTFNYWDWHNGSGTIFSAGTNNSMQPLKISGPDSYFMSLDNGLCSQTTQVMNVTPVNCDCGWYAYMNSVFTCDPNTPGGYTLDLTLNSPGTNFIIGLSNGPAMPFNVFLPPGIHTITLNVTMLMNPPVDIELSYGNGPLKCYQRISVTPTYPCSWNVQRPETVEETPVATGLLVFPNPANQTVSVNYRFGGTDATRQLVVYDMAGRKVSVVPVAGADGTQTLQVADWTPGVYVLRMEENGHILHTQKITISH